MKLAMPLEPQMLRNTVLSDKIGVDRETNTIYGFVVAELGPFKTPGRGEFTQESLEQIVELGNAKQGGLKSRFQHPSASDDGLGKLVGRAKNFRLDGDKVRADLHISPTALKPPPNGGGTPLGEYVLALAEEDPGAFSTSLVLRPEQRFRLEEDGTRSRDKDGQPLPPIWIPQELMATDVVDTGDAVNDFLSAQQLESLPNGGIFQVTEALGKIFKGQDRDVVQARCLAFLGRYLDQHFGPVEPSKKEKDMADEGSKVDALQEQLALALGKIEELQGLVVSQAEERKAAELQAQKERKVREKCKMLGSGQFSYDGKKLSAADIADALLGDESLSESQINDRLFSLMAQSRLSNEDGNMDHDNQDLDAKYREEYLSGLRWHKQLRVSQDDYIEARKIEDGIVEAPAPALSEDWAYEQENKLRKELGLEPVL